MDNGNTYGIGNANVNEKHLCFASPWYTEMAVGLGGINNFNDYCVKFNTIIMVL